MAFIFGVKIEVSRPIAKSSKKPHLWENVVRPSYDNAAQRERPESAILRVMDQNGGKNSHNKEDVESKG